MMADRRLLGRLGSVAGGVFFGLAGLLAAVVDLRSEGVLQLGNELIQGRQVSAAVMEKIVDGPHRLTIGATCRSDFIVAAGTIAAALRGTVIEAGDVGRVRPTLKHLETTARTIIDCSPGMGIAWTWLALAREQLGAPTPEVRSLLERSQRLAPSEYWVITERLPYAAQIASRRGAGFDDVIRADIRTLFGSSVPVSQVAEIMGPGFRWMERIAQQEYARLDDPVRRDGLLHAFGPWSANVAGCTRERFHDWSYRGWPGTCEDAGHLPDFDWRKAPKS